MSILENVISKTLLFLKALYNREAYVTGVCPQDDGWLINVEIIEEDEYMRKRGRREIVGIYGVQMDRNFNVISFKRQGLKERGTIMSEDSEE